MCGSQLCSQEVLTICLSPHLLRGGDHNFFPTFQQSDEKIAAIKESLIEDPLNLHYDAKREVRAKAAAFYQFSGDADERQRQMDELRTAREDTVQQRTEAGAQDTADPGSSTPTVDDSRGITKRKREIEERRQAIEAKRRKMNPSASIDLPQTSSTVPRAGDPVAATPTPPVDPFARLEGQLGSAGPQQKADAFLASIERDIRG